MPLSDMTMGGLTVIPIFATVICAFGLLNFHSQDDIWDIYSPLNGLSRLEEKQLEKFEHASSSHHYRIQIIVDRIDGGNLLNVYDISEISNMHRFVSDNVTSNDGRRQLHYREMCGVYCNDSNSIVLGFLQASAEVGTGRTTSTSIVLSYPNAHAVNRNLFIGYSVGNIHRSETNDDIIDGFRLFVLHYMVDLSLPNGRTLARDFERKLRVIFANATADSRHLQYALLSRDRELEEQRQITLVALPYLLLTGLICTIFMLVTLINFPLYKSQHVEAVFAVISPIMALVTSIGFLWGIGYPFSNILTVVPFLVVTIGIDDAFLILAGWRHSSTATSFEARMGMTMAKSGASVTVTSVTDVLCFSVGLMPMVSNMPVVQLFCLYTSLALTIDFVYQVTFFTAIVAYCGRRQMAIEEKLRFKASPLTSLQLCEQKVNRNEYREDHSNSSSNSPRLLFFRRIAPGFLNLGIRSEKLSGSSSLRSPPSLTSASSKDETKTACDHDGYLIRFVHWLHWPSSKMLIMLVFILHLAASTHLCTQVNTDFDMENLYLQDSPLNGISRKMQDFVLREAFVVNFALTSMPSFDLPAVRAQFNAMIDELENIPRFGRGKDGTTLWTRDYEEAIQFWGESDDFWQTATLLENIREHGIDEKYFSISKDPNNKDHIDGFYWSIAYHNMRNFLDVQHLMEQSGLFHSTSHHPLEKVPTESAASAPQNFIQTAVSAVILMSLLVFLFVLNLGAILSVVLSILSICAGTVGYLHLWSVHLDAISLISMLMSIGFSVDYSAHICYHFFTHIDEENGDGGSEMGSISTGKTISIIVGDGNFSHIVPTLPDTPPPPIPTSIPKIGDKKSISSDDVTANSNRSSASAEGRSKLSATERRLEATFNGVGWPVVQSGLSTVLGMVPLILVRAYVVAVFWKTVILVTVLGMFHALFLLPVLFLLISDLSAWFRRKILRRKWRSNCS